MKLLLVTSFRNLVAPIKHTCTNDVIRDNSFAMIQSQRHYPLGYLSDMDSFEMRV